MKIKGEIRKADAPETIYNHITEGSCHPAEAAAVLHAISILQNADDAFCREVMREEENMYERKRRKGETDGKR